MITKIVLHNFQCHKDVTIELGRSTVLQGNSNSGKTAVLRALYWVIYNTPSGDSYVSYWAKGKTKFKGDEYTSVIVEVDGHTIERKRSNDFNGYIVDGNIYEALRTAVPEAVTKIFNLSDASVQKQMDAPFLLAATPGEASQYLNSLAGLECVDEILTIGKRKVSDTLSEMATLKEEVEALDKEYNSYGWVEEAEELLEKASATEPKIDSLQRKIASLSQSIADYKAIKQYPEIPEWLENGDCSEKIAKTEKTVDALRKYITACEVLERVVPAIEGVEALELPKPSKYTDKELSSLIRSVREYRNASATDIEISGVLSEIGNLREPKPSKWESSFAPFADSIRSYKALCKDADAVSLILDDISRLKQPKPCKWTEKDLTALIRSVRNYKGAVNSEKACEDELEEIYGSLDGVVCPTCGRPITKDIAHGL